jgi:hypothetical protein
MWFVICAVVWSVDRGLFTGNGWLGKVKESYPRKLSSSSMLRVA